MEIEKFANQIRIELLKINHGANASHSGSALSVVDILAVIYSKYIGKDLNGNHQLFFSKGHAGSAVYSALALKEYFPIKDLSNYGKNGSILTTHVSHKVPGIEVSSGSLGLTLSVAAGVAYARKLKNETGKIFVILSDGELDEGSNWEVFLSAPHFKLDNLIVIIDYNKIQSFGTVKEVIDLDPLTDKFQSFNWETFELDGHDVFSIKNNLESLKNNSKPKLIIANTIKGKGVSFMENKLEWHYRSPNENQLNEAINEINNSNEK